MSQLSIIDIAKQDLYTSQSELEGKYPVPQIEHLLRLRDMVTWSIANPDMKDRQFVDELRSRYGLSQVTAYADLKIVKALLPNLSECTRDFHRWRTNEMLIATYKMAEKRKDSKTMERAATAYGKLNRVDLEDEQAIPLDQILVQPFMATDDPRVLGIEPIPNIAEKISSMIEKYRKETIDIEDVEFEEYDLEFDTLFPDKSESDPDDGTEESVL